MSFCLRHKIFQREPWHFYNSLFSQKRNSQYLPSVRGDLKNIYTAQWISGRFPNFPSLNAVSSTRQRSTAVIASNPHQTLHILFIFIIAHSETTMSSGAGPSRSDCSRRGDRHKSSSSDTSAGRAVRGHSDSSGLFFPESGSDGDTSNVSAGMFAAHLMLSLVCCSALWQKQANDVLSQQLPLETPLPAQVTPRELLEVRVLVIMRVSVFP